MLPSHSLLSKVPLVTNSTRLAWPTGWRSNHLQAVPLSLSEDQGSELVIPLDISYGVLDYVDIFFSEDRWGDLMYLSCFPFCLIESFELVCIDEDVDYYSGKELFLHQLFEKKANTGCIHYICPPLFIRNKIPDLSLRIKFHPMEKFHYQLLSVKEKQSEILDDALSFLPTNLSNLIQEYDDDDLFLLQTELIISTNIILPDSSFLRQLYLNQMTP